MACPALEEAAAHGIDLSLGDFEFMGDFHVNSQKITKDIPNHEYIEHELSILQEIQHLNPYLLFNLRNDMILYRSRKPPQSFCVVHLFLKGFFPQKFCSKSWEQMEKIFSFDRNQNAFLLIHGWTVTPLLLELLPFLSTRPTPATATAVSDVLGGVKAGPLAIALRSCCALGLVQFHAGHWA